MDKTHKSFAVAFHETRVAPKLPDNFPAIANKALGTDKLLNHIALTIGTRFELYI